ncbi:MULTISPECIES: sensor histidine kinase [Agrobacterium]|uniref:histidine kinase n=1 Tax=Agrobacterium salinitolerans TaxID=1183413 RepID=A0ABY3BMQ6_9HYPH|nr:MULTISPECIES: sensor histidine kinase [Agrobacterium]MCZ7887764.1 sensor histidine kinase [Agrobacterium salinitolerans]MCZ7893520.1 sensor histidine kinase [Agrobacterium salinitolerans]MDA5629965.1 sensor histidine kinase [Agrobacterium sp. ST15.16.055]MDA6980736.1 sensor histidine kinase [Agrobacterium salinitolerans]TRA88590.1 histidine kinase [Agrobacterium salinitolerans]
MPLPGNRLKDMISALRRRSANFFPTASIGTYLVVMATVITLPLILFGGYLMLRLEAEKRDDLQRETIEDVRVASRNIDRRLQEIATSLNLLSQFPELESGNLAAFQGRVADSLKREGLYAILTTKDGQQRLNTRMPYGQPLGKVPAEANLAKAIDSGRITVSNMFFGQTSKEWVFNVTLPLGPDLDAAGDALILTQNTSDLSRLIPTETLPRNWAVAIIDGNNRVVVSSAPDEAEMGKPFVTPDVLSEMQAFSGNFFDGKGNLYAYAQLPGWQWKTVMWGPLAASQAALIDTWRQMMIGSLVLVLIAIGGAYLVGRQLRSSIRDLTLMAERIGEGEIVAPIDTKIKEANQVAIALSNASFDRSQSEERLQLLLHELVHRSKNILTLVQAMIRQLGRENKSIPEFQKEVDHRLRGLGMSIRALAEVQWQGLPIRKLIETHLEVFGTVAHRVVLIGDDFMLSPEAAQNFGLVIHELTTNSIKYGALSVPTGKITVRWQPFEKDGRQMIHLVWTETGGPPASEPSRKGFGTTVIKRHAEGAFGGQVLTQYREAGFEWTLEAPMRYFTPKRSEQTGQH